MGRRIRVVGVCVQLRVGGGHAADPGDGRDAARRGLGAGRTAADASVRQHGMDSLVPGVEEVPDVDPRLRRPEPEALVRLVPDQPVADPRIAARDGCREASEVARVRRRVLRRASAVRPTRRPDEREHGCQTVAAKPAQDLVGPTPVVGAIARRSRVLRPSRGDLVPAQREADDRHAEPLERYQPLVERSRAPLQPGIVLNPVADARCCLSGARGGDSREREQQHDQRHPAGGRPHRAARP